MSTPRHREAVDRAAAEAAARVPAKTPRPEPLFSPSASKRRTERRAQAATLAARAAMLKEIVAFVATLSDVWSPAQIAGAINKRFALPVRK